LVADHLNREGINAVRHQTIVFQDPLKHVPWVAFDRTVDETSPHQEPGPFYCDAARPLTGLLHVDGCSCNSAVALTAFLLLRIAREPDKIA
jgi:hypothetical protein